MGGMCSPSGGINEPIVDDDLSNIKVRNGPSNSRTDLYNERGDLIQSRWYGPDGWAIWDRDYLHGDSLNTHKFPHDHKWEWKWNRKKDKFELERSKELPEINPDYC